LKRKRANVDVNRMLTVSIITLTNVLKWQCRSRAGGRNDRTTCASTMVIA